MTHAASNVTSAELAENICVPYDRLFKDQAVSRVVQKKATTIKDGKVVLEDGEEIPYAYLVVATGKQWVSPIEYALFLLHPWIAMSANALPGPAASPTNAPMPSR